MNKLIVFVCALALAFSSQTYAGKGARNAAILGIVGIGAYQLGKHSERNKRRAPRYSRAYARSPMEQAFKSQSRHVRKQLQIKLQEKELYHSYIDGYWGRGTRTALESFATETGKTHLLTTESGANEFMRFLLSPEDSHTSISDSGSGSSSDMGGGSYSDSGSSSGMGGGSYSDSGSSSDTGGGSYMGSSSGADSMAGGVTGADDLAGTDVNADMGADIDVNRRDDSEELAQIKQKLDLVSQQLSLLKEVLRVQGSQGGQQNSFHQAEIEALNKRIAAIEDFQKQTISDVQMRSDRNFRTADLNLSAPSVQASKIYPKIPYYVPETDDLGEMWIAPRVTNRGGLIYDFNFMEPGGAAENVRETISMPAVDMADLMYGIEKAHEWSDVAKQKAVRQKHEKVAVCFPS